MTTPEMRILTVRQPWAWAIIHGGKDVENRARNLAGDYRGPVAIHAGLIVEPEDAAVWDMDEYRDAFSSATAHVRHRVDERGSVLGVVDLVDVHRSSRLGGCADTNARSHMRRELCSPWAEADTTHLVLEHPRLLAEPIPYRGALGLRRLDDTTTARILAQIGA